MERNFIKEGEKDIKEIWRRIRKKDFSGNTGLAVKNSMYQFSTNFVAKIGSLIFTIILARLLMPELFGLYSLALSTILIFSAISELGIGMTLVRFVSRELGKINKKKAKAYTFYLGKIKLILIVISAFLLLISAKLISNNFYQKPIFLALLAGVLYIIFIQIFGFLQSLFQVSNYFRGLFHKEIVFQISRLILVPLAVLFALRYTISNEQTLFYIILMLAVSYLFTALFMFFIFTKKIDFIKGQKTKLTKRQNKETNKFLLATATFILSGLFFSYIDKIMLGRFVAAEFIGYYSVAFSLIGALTSLMGFGIVLLPIFSRLKRKQLELALKKSIKIIFFLGLVLFFGTLFLAPFAILIVYGVSYSPAINILRILSLLLILLPLIGIYTSYFLSKGKPQTVAKLLIFATVINVFLNYILITSLMKYGDLAAVYGAGIATLISQFFYMTGLMISRKKGNKKQS